MYHKNTHKTRRLAGRFSDIDTLIVVGNHMVCRHLPTLARFNLLHTGAESGLEKEGQTSRRWETKGRRQPWFGAVVLFETWINFVVVHVSCEKGHPRDGFQFFLRVKSRACRETQRAEERGQVWSGLFLVHNFWCTQCLVANYDAWHSIITVARTQ